MTNSPQSCSAASEGLKPCPFCGSDTFMSNTETCWVRCINHDCCAEGPTADSEWQAAAMWNKRTGDAAQAAGLSAIVRDCREAAKIYRERRDHRGLKHGDDIAAIYERVADSIERAAQPPAAPIETGCCKGLAPQSDCRCEIERKAAGHPPYPRSSAVTETVTEGCSDEHCEFFEMLWKWFADESRHGKAEMRANNIDGGLSAADFEEMLNEHEANIMHVPPQEVQVLDFFSQSVDAWGALEWFDRLAKAVREQDKAVVAGDMITMETCRNVASSSAMRLVRDYEPLVRAALALTRPHGGGK